MIISKTMETDLFASSVNIWIQNNKFFTSFSYLFLRLVQLQLHSKHLLCFLPWLINCSLKHYSLHARSIFNACMHSSNHLPIHPFWVISLIPMGVVCSLIQSTNTFLSTGHVPIPVLCFSILVPLFSLYPPIPTLVISNCYLPPSPTPLFLKSVLYINPCYSSNFQEG